MANRNYPSQKMFGFHMLPVRVGGSITIGSTGAVASFTGKGINAITRLAAGVYRIQLQDNYYAFLNAHFNMEEPTTGSTALGSITPGVVYQIATLGTSTAAQWHTAGLPAGITPAVGQVFLAAATSGGTGTVSTLVSSAVNQIDLVGNPQTMLNNQPFNAGSGGYITFKCVGPTDASTTTPVATDPVSGSKIYFELWLNNSSVQ